MVLVCLKNRKKEGREGSKRGREERRKVCFVSGAEFVRNSIQVHRDHMHFLSSRFFN